MPTDQGNTLGHGHLRNGSARMLDFMEWWGSTLADMTPAWLTNAFFPRRNWVPVRLTDDDFVVYSVDGSQIGLLASSAKARSLVRSKDVLVLLEPGEAFLRQRRLPASSEINLRNALRLQIAADTPFDLDEVFEDCRVIDRETGSGFLTAEQAIVRREEIRRLQAAALTARIDIAGVDIADENHQPRGFNLLPEAERARPDAFLPSLNRALAVAALLLAGVVGSLYVLSLERRASALDDRISLAKADAAEVLAIQREVRARAEAVSVIEAQSADPARFTELLNELSRALPDDTWLEGLAYDGNQISLVGLSRSSDGLVAKLEQIPGVVAARVVSSVMRDDRLEADRFRIELVLEAPAPLPPPAPAADFPVEENG